MLLALLLSTVVGFGSTSPSRGELADKPQSTLTSALIAGEIEEQPLSGDADVIPSDTANYKEIYRQNFNAGLENNMQRQGPESDSVLLVPAPDHGSGLALKASMKQTDDFSRVANGSPRAEVSFRNKFTFQQGHEYWVRWSIFIPENYRFDSLQPEVISQIHQGPNAGIPPFSISLQGDQYQVNDQKNHFPIGSAEQDKGRWVHWTLHYKPDSSRQQSITELFKDGQSVFNHNGIPNAYPEDNQAYLKLGIYKWWWQSKPSSVTERTLYFDDVSVMAR